jgi:hypothetical protein
LGLEELAPFVCSYYREVEGGEGGRERRKGEEWW